MSFLVIIGNPRPGSRTATAARAAANAIAAEACPTETPQTLDLSALGPRTLDADAGPDLTAALERVAAADLLLIASPTYKGAYTGLLKAFLDRLPGGALTGKTALPLLLLGTPRHAPAVETHLRPLLVELGATVPAPGLALLENDLDRLDSVVAEWAGRVAPAVRGARTAGADR